MARNSEVSIAIYEAHLRLFRYLNDTWIYSELLRPHLKNTAVSLRESTSRARKPYRVPKDRDWIESRRRDYDLAQLFQSRYERGLFEANLVNIVSRVEAFVQEALTIVILRYPQKLTMIGDKAGVPLEMVLATDDRETLLARYVESRCQGFMYGRPTDYLNNVAKVLSISIDKDLIARYAEIKASRDLIVHGSGLINQLYIEKAGAKARGELKDELALDRSYFRHVVVTAKKLSGKIQAGTEEKYG